MMANLDMNGKQRQPDISDSKAVRERDKQLKINQKKNFDVHHGVREMDLLSTGQQLLVWLPDTRVEAQVDEQVAPRSYTVSTSRGQTRRNRRDLIPLLTQSITPTQGPLETETSIQRNNNTASESSARRSSRVSNPPT